jgi:isoquinoline 1-oxidoreductase alpha subunit
LSEYSLSINGQKLKVDVSEDTPLLWVLRDTLDLTGTKYGCGMAQCGACTIHIDGMPTRSCVTPVTLAIGKEITTIEGLSENGDHPVQKAWDTLDVPQCGFCQSGQMMTAAALLKENPNPDEEEISMAMSAHICRCGTYHRINEAVKLAAKLQKK